MPALKGALNRIAMRHTLPVLLLIVSMLLFVEGQHQFNGAVFGGELRFWDRFPPPAERLERSISFPAVVLRAPIDAMPIMNRPIFGTSLGRTWPLVFSLNDLTGFAWVGFFWFVVGFHLDAWRRPTLSRFQCFLGPASPAAIVSSAILGLGCLMISRNMMNSTPLYRQLAWAGLIWGLALMLYVPIQLRTRARGRVHLRERAP